MSASENTQHHLESFVISATLACNLRCMHCYVNAGEPAQYEVSTEELISAVDQAINLGAASFTFTGGEVFLRKDLLEVLRFVADRGCSIGFETNGTLLTEEKVQTLVDIDPNIFFAISLDGITRHTHEAFRGVPGCFDLTMRGICNVAKVGARLQIITVINTLNVQELPAIYDFSQNAVGAVSRFLLISPEGRAREHGDFTLPADKIHEICTDLIFPWMRENKRVHIDIPLALIPPDLDASPRCPSGISMMGMSQDGYLGICGRINASPELSGGHIHTHSLESVWKSDLFEKMRNISHQNLKGVCGNCIAAYICRGRCRVSAYFISNGDFYAPHPVCQAFYAAGLFPRYAMIEPDLDSSYEF